MYLPRVWRKWKFYPYLKLLYLNCKTIHILPTTLKWKSDRLLSYLPILKNKLQIKKLCGKENNHFKFNKFKFIFEDTVGHLHRMCIFTFTMFCVNCLLLKWSPMCSTYVMYSVYMSLLYFIFHFSKSNIFAFISS